MRPQGKALTAGVRQVHVDFAAAFAALQKVDYDPTDHAEARWADDHGRFQSALRDLERRLSHLVVVVRLLFCSSARHTPDHFVHRGQQQPTAMRIQVEIYPDQTDRWP